MLVVSIVIVRWVCLLDAIESLLACFLLFRRQKRASESGVSRRYLRRNQYYKTAPLIVEPNPAGRAQTTIHLHNDDVNRHHRCSLGYHLQHIMPWILSTAQQTGINVANPQYQSINNSLSNNLCTRLSRRVHGWLLQSCHDGTMS